MTVAINTLPYASFDGTDTVKDFPITHNTFEVGNIVASIYDVALGTFSDLVYNTDFTLTNIGIPGASAKFTLKDAADVPPGWSGPIPPSQKWLTSGNLKTGFVLFIKFNTDAMQPVTQPNTPQKLETIVDRLTMNIKALKYEVQKALKFSDYTFKTDGDPATAEDLVTRMQELEDEVDAFVNSGGALPSGGLDGEFLEGDTSDPIGAVWKSGSYDGISQLTGQQFTSTGLKDTLDKIIRITYTPPQIVLSMTPGQGLREKGTLVSTVDMNVTVTKKSNDIGAVRYYRSGVLVNTNATPPAGGGAMPTYTNNTPFSDTMSFYAQVDDILSGGNGPTMVQSNTVTFSYVYPYYYGAGPTGKTPAQVAALTKSVIAATATLPVTFTAANGDVFYFAYPAAYSALFSILDPNGFETIADWTVTTGNITGLDGTPQSYRIYRFNNPVVAGSTQYTFKR